MSGSIISVGILAWNEESSIGDTLRDIYEQSLLARPGKHAVEVVVVANGCSDQTVETARQVLKDLTVGESVGPDEKLPAGSVSARVVDIPRPGKVNAWNEFVHQHSRSDTDYFVFADADIRFHGEQTLEQMIKLLEQKPEVLATTDEPIKHVALKPNPTWPERLSLAISAMTKAAPGQLTGQLYAARAVILREIVMPEGLIVEDGFLKQFICTRGFTQLVDNSLIERAPQAAHVFEAYLRVSDILPNQRRQAMGHTIYTYLRDYLRKQAESGCDAAATLRENQERDPEWFLTLIRERVATGGWWIMHKGALLVRWRRWWAMPGLAKKLTCLPAALAGWCLDVVVYSWANWTLKQGKLKGIWKDTRTQKLGDK